MEKEGINMEDEERVDHLKQIIKNYDSNKIFWAKVEVKLKNSFQCMDEDMIPFRLKVDDDLYEKIDENDILHLKVENGDVKVLSIDKL